MKVAILADSQPSYRLPMALSLQRILQQIGVQSVIFDEGTEILNNPYRKRPFFALLKNQVKYFLNTYFNHSHQIVTYRSEKKITDFAQLLQPFEAVIVVAHLPLTLSKHFYQGVDILKTLYDQPILNYDLCFWATRGDWWQRVVKEPYYGGFVGLQRFDWYLAVSNVSEYPIKKGVNFPVSVIGGNFSNSHLFPEQKEFRVLIDFERKEHLSERRLQIEVLEKNNIPYTVLKGVYSHEELYAIFRQHSAYFIAHRESFGLPVVELQCCGAVVFAPYYSWLPSHFLKNPYESGEGKLGSNFFIYENSAAILTEQLRHLQANFDAQRNIQHFENEYPHLYKGSAKELQKVMIMIQNGEIGRGKSGAYVGLEKEIIF